MSNFAKTAALSLAAALAMGGAAFAQDAAKGEAVFKRCAACHAVGASASNKAGPQLNGLIGRKIAGVEGYTYSDALTAFGEGKTWDAATLDSWLKDAKTLVPGNKMSFAGLKKDDERGNLVAYLSGIGEDGATK